MKNLLFLSFFLCVYTIQAQVRFSLGVGLGAALESTNINSNEITGISYAVLNDSLMEKQFSKRLSTSKYTYVPKLEYSIFGDVDFRLSKRMEISTGIGFSFYFFDIERSSSIKFLESEVLDTVPYKQLSVLSSSCDSTVSIPGGGVFGKRDFGILDLHIPVSIKYELFDGLKVSLGARLSTPVFTRQNGFRPEREIKVENGKTICINTTHGYIDHSGDGFRQMRMSVMGGLHYRIFDHLEVNVQMAKSLNNVFVNKNNFISKGVFKPLQIRLGASLFLGEHPSNKKNSKIE